MLKRITTGLILTPIVICGILYLPSWGFFCLVELAILLAVYEFLSLGGMIDIFSRIMGLTVGFATGICIMLQPDRIPDIFLISSIAILVYNLFRPRPIEQAALRTSMMLSSVFYVVLLGSTMLILGVFASHGREKLLLACAAIWLGDTFAFFGGKGIGGAKLYEIISPKKTWAGAVTGIIGSLLGGFLVRILFYTDITATDCLIVSFTAGAAGQIGDLAESLFKRSFNVKDSGTILPGHGGMLDRIDALLLGIPAAYTVFKLIGI
jgi:phosphatidate cytidylyltransferase